ncbi:tRNA lysidine(34) synthetase TilS [Pseudomonas sp. RIT-PI-S]|uniref:tRNA lysidine(34) synthetase TilS n=1 Tax=Pseudomonas sp. RIT-PI-S TaxID=3035295 RepID=UPI0021D99725|nr:tRNA lysidine(34) synthetase TilS [Pseudomonas sp. RIT-PI-S]
MSLGQHLLQHLEPWRDAPGWIVALSGGLDSSVLLHALATLGREHSLPPLRAIHVHHGLQSAADAWPAHCERLCQSLGVPLQVMRVHVEPLASIEQAARNARYSAFAAELRAGELLLIGQHRDDQAETLLLRLMRGAGLRGAAGMPEARPLGQGTLARPLLELGRDALLEYARDVGLQWIEDPSNADSRHARNYLRHEVLPQLQARWPAASANLARSAGHFAEALALLEQLATDDLAVARQASPFAWLALPSLALAPLRELSEARQRNALQAWLAPLSRLPDTDHWVGWVALRDAAPGAAPVWPLADGALVRAGDRAWWLAGLWQSTPSAPPGWSNLAEPLRLPGNGELQWHGPVPAGAVEVRYRQGGERLVLPGRGSRDLKRLLNEAGVPPFVRARLPLLVVEGHLVAVANLQNLSAIAGTLRWRPPTNDRCLR